MQALYTLPVLEDLFVQKKYDQALSVLNESVETLGPHLKGKFPADLIPEPEEALILVRLYIVQQEYGLCMQYAYLARDILHKLNSFYYTTVIYRIMEYLIVQKVAPEDPQLYSGLRSFIIEYIKEDEPSDSLLGFLAEIGEFNLLKQHLLSLSKQDVKCDVIVSHILNEYYDDVSDVLLKMDMTNKHLHYFIIDAYIYENKVEELTALLATLPWNLLYRACFYIEDTYQTKFKLENENANFILSGDWKREIMSNFMLKNSKTSFKFIESMSKARAPFISLCNSIMNAATTNDTFYRNNKGMSTGKEWSRFLEYSAIGMIHQGNINAFEILKEMLPSLESTNGEPATLMALGLMNAGSYDRECTDYLLNWLDASNEEIVFGACMGLGLCMLESCDDSLYKRLSALLSVDSTVIQESAIYAIGMVFAGSRNVEVMEFVRSIQNKSDFPRVKRVCSMAAGIISIWGEKDVAASFARSVKAVSTSEPPKSNADDGSDSGYESVSEEKADVPVQKEPITIKSMSISSFNASKSHRKNRKENKGSSTEKCEELSGCIPQILDSEGILNALESSDAFERESILLSLGTSFASTGNLAVVKKILPYINDSDDDVKRTAVISIGLIGYDDEEIIKLCIIPFAENHNQLVRATVALILGFFSCGKGNQTICNLLEAMMYDADDLVRQSAYIGVGFALVQANPSVVSNYKRILDRMNYSISSKNESACVKNGAALGRAIAEAGGRSAVFSLCNFHGQEDIKRVVGALLFFQSWYWYPLMSCLSMCLLPTPIFFFNENLDETDDVIDNEPKYYDFLVKIPESRKSRKFKATKDGDGRDTITEAPRGLRSGARMVEMERIGLNMDCGVVFKDGENN